MQKLIFHPEQDNFYGAFYPCPEPTDKVFLLMSEKHIQHFSVKAAVKWFHSLNCHVMALSPERTAHNYRNYPIEQIAAAVQYLSNKGFRKIGIFGFCFTGTIALAAASFIPEIRLTIAFSPCDFIMESFSRSTKPEKQPMTTESILSNQGKPLPFMRYAYHFPELQQKMQEEAKRRHDCMAFRDVFDFSEALHPLQENQKIPVEKIQGRLVLIGTEDNSFWNACRYIHRIEERLLNTPHDCRYKIFLYEHGSAFCFPQSMLENIFPVGSALALAFAFESLRDFPIESHHTRTDIDKKLSYLIGNW